jgi:hypothetical protein
MNSIRTGRVAILLEVRVVRTEERASDEYACLSWT